MPDPSIINCSEQIIIRPRVTRVEGQPILAKIPSLLTSQGVTPVMELVLRDSEGRPINLTECGFSSSISSSMSEGSGSQRIIGKMREVISESQENAPVELEAIVINPEAGVIRARVPAAATELNGIMRGQFAFMDSDSSILFTSSFFLMVDRGEFGTNVNFKGVPSPEDIRVFLRDNSPEDNYLLSELEFDLTEIVESAIRCLQHFNSAQPPITQKFDSTNFPNPVMLLNGIMGYLYQIAAKHYRRNHLPYSAGGMQIDDKNKAAEYEQMGAQMLGEYQAWVKNKKAQYNAQNWNGSFGSGYDYGGRWR
jgi:hypothetical protein